MCFPLADCIRCVWILMNVHCSHFRPLGQFVLFHPTCQVGQIVLVCSNRYLVMVSSIICDNLWKMLNPQLFTQPLSIWVRKLAKAANICGRNGRFACFALCQDLNESLSLYSLQYFNSHQRAVALSFLFYVCIVNVLIALSKLSRLFCIIKRPSFLFSIVLFYNSTELF